MCCFGRGGGLVVEAAVEDLVDLEASHGVLKGDEPRDEKVPPMDWILSAQSARCGVGRYRRKRRAVKRVMWMSREVHCVARCDTVASC